MFSCISDTPGHKWMGATLDGAGAAAVERSAWTDAEVRAADHAQFDRMESAAFRLRATT